LRTEKPTPIFRWHCFDVSTRLPSKWSESVHLVAARLAREKTLRPTSVTSREASGNLELPVLTVGGITVQTELPWLDRLYRSLFLELAQSLTVEEVRPATDQRYALNLNVQRGATMRYECHVDSNPIEGLLYITTHGPGNGGELVVSNVGDVGSPEEVDRDATCIYPISGHLIFFDARRHSHYVRPLNDPNMVRIVVAMNYYTQSCPESSRPSDLNEHLGIE
jgi:hypothetical protein